MGLVYDNFRKSLLKFLPYCGKLVGRLLFEAKRSLSVSQGLALILSLTKTIDATLKKDPIKSTQKFQR